MQIEHIEDEDILVVLNFPLPIKTEEHDDQDVCIVDEFGMATAVTGNFMAHGGSAKEKSDYSLIPESCIAALPNGNISGRLLPERFALDDRVSILEGSAFHPQTEEDKKLFENLDVEKEFIFPIPK